MFPTSSSGLEFPNATTLVAPGAQGNYYQQHGQLVPYNNNQQLVPSVPSSLQNSFDPAAFVLPPTNAHLYPPPHPEGIWQTWNKEQALWQDLPPEVSNVLNSTMAQQLPGVTFNMARTAFEFNLAAKTRTNLTTGHVRPIRYLADARDWTDPRTGLVGPPLLNDHHHLINDHHYRNKHGHDEYYHHHHGRHHREGYHSNDWVDDYDEYPEFGQEQYYRDGRRVSPKRRHKY